MATSKNTSTTTEENRGEVRISSDLSDRVTERLQQIAAQLTCLAITLTDNEGGAKPGDQLIGISIYGVASSVEDVREMLIGGAA